MVNRQAIEQFIETYKNLPCLWDLKNEQYHNRDSRDAAYEKLIEKLKEVEPTADKDACIRKINNLRSTVRREKRKIEKSILSGKTGSAVYKSKLWYFELFDFLNKPGIYIPRQTTIKMEEYSESYSDINETASQLYSSEDEHESVSDNNPFVSNSTNQIDSHDPLNVSRQTKRPNNQDFTNDIKRPRIQEDRWDLLGRSVAVKLRNLDERQGLVAEKLINDVLFEAEYGSLKLNQFVSHIGNESNDDH